VVWVCCLVGVWSGVGICLGVSGCRELGSLRVGWIVLKWCERLVELLS
jgi:hypothetical protein